MKKTERIAKLETAAYILAITASRDNNATQAQDKEVLTKIKEYLHQIITLKNGNPNFVVLGTVGMSEEEGINLANDFDKEEK